MDLHTFIYNKVGSKAAVGTHGLLSLSNNLVGVDEGHPKSLKSVGQKRIFPGPGSHKRNPASGRNGVHAMAAWNPASIEVREGGPAPSNDPIFIQ